MKRSQRLWVQKIVDSLVKSRAFDCTVVPLDGSEGGNVELVLQGADAPEVAEYIVRLGLEVIDVEVDQDGEVVRVFLDCEDWNKVLDSVFARVAAREAAE